MDSQEIILITLEGKEILVNKFPYQFKKRSKVYFDIKYNKENKQLDIKGVHPYSVKIMDSNLIQQKYPENFDKILILKNENENSVQNFGGKIDLSNDNVVSTITLIKMVNFQEANKNALKSEKQTNLITIKNKSINNEEIENENDQFRPQILKEPVIQNPQKIVNSNQLSINLMTFEERDLLKKAILSYGYDRWNYIQKNFEEKNQLGLRKKTIPQIRSYANSLIKSIADNLNFQNYDLKQLLMYLIHQPFELPSNPSQEIQEEFEEKQKLNQQMKQDQYICVNSRDWDLNSIRQRAKPWAKRILIMYRINNFIKDYIKYFYKKYQFQPQKFFDFFQLLNFLDVNQLSGQKPSSWWSVFHDMHLLYSTYFNGYANYLHAFILKNINIPKTWYFFPNGKKINEFGQQNPYKKLNYMNIKVDFYTEIMILQLPSADAITRRLKKLINIIFKLSGEQSEKITSNNNLEKLFQNIPEKEILNLIDHVKEEGIPFNQNTNKFNYEELKNKVDLSIDLTGKKIQQIINLLNLTAFLILNEDTDELRKNSAMYKNQTIQRILNQFDKEKAEEFLRNNNVLYFLRSKFIPQNILQKKFGDFSQIVVKFIQPSNEIYNKINLENYQKIFDELNQNGFRNINTFYQSLGLQNVYSLANMIFLFFEYLKPEIENFSPTITKKRKIQYLYQVKRNQNQSNEYHPQDNRRKINILSQDLKNIEFPIQISSSLKIISLGKLSHLPYYHNEHCLFPIGFKSVRLSYSTKFKNQKCEYYCEILEGPQQKPIFKVTSEENQNSPYVSEDPNTCWKQIYKEYCQVNDKPVENVVVSGTERFGLLDSIVINMLENLEGLDQCTQYIKKKEQIIIQIIIKSIIMIKICILLKIYYYFCQDFFIIYIQNFNVVIFQFFFKNLSILFIAINIFQLILKILIVIEIILFKLAKQTKVKFLFIIFCISKNFPKTNFFGWKENIMKFFIEILNQKLLSIFLLKKKSNELIFFHSQKRLSFLKIFILQIQRVFAMNKMTRFIGALTIFYIILAQFCCSKMCFYFLIIQSGLIQSKYCNTRIFNFFVINVH